MLTVPPGSHVEFTPEGAYVQTPLFAPTLYVLPAGYRVRNKAVGGGDSTLPAGHTAYYIQHESFPWVGEGQPYPRVELEKT